MPRKIPFYLLQVNTLSLRRSKPFKDEEKAYNKTLEFIDELPSKLDGTKPSILISHTTLKRISNKATIAKVRSCLHLFLYYLIPYMSLIVVVLFIVNLSKCFGQTIKLQPQRKLLKQFHSLSHFAPYYTPISRTKKLSPLPNPYSNVVV